MKIVWVDKPLQDDYTLEPQLIDGVRYNWCVKSEMCKRNESFQEWWVRKQDEMEYRSKGEKLVEGIFLYNVEGVGGIPESEDVKYPWALMVRYDWIKIK